METFYFKKISELKKEFLQLKKKLKVKMILRRNQLIIDGEAIDEFTASKVLGAMSFGFSAKKSLLLLEEDMDFKIIHIKNFTRRKDMHDVRARIIGKEGKTKRTLENITSSYIELNGNEVGIIAPVEAIDTIVIGIKNVIKGSKQANVYAYLERMNTSRKRLAAETSDLGLKDKKE